MDDNDFDYELFREKYGIDLSSEDDIDGDIEAVQPDIPVRKAQKAQESKAGRARLELYDWLQCIVSAILCGILIFVFIGRVIGVDGNSMLDTLRDRDTVIMSNLFYTPKYGDIIVFRDDKYDNNKPLVKRVIATEGQTVDIDFNTGKVFIDGHEIVEPYIREPTHESLGFKGPKTVPKGCVFVMGDNRNQSADSRSDMVGMVDTRQILGKVLFVMIPGKNADGTRPWDKFGSVYRKAS
jgi:signal peptidase I